MICVSTTVMQAAGGTNEEAADASSRKALLRARSHAFAQAFISPPPPSEILSIYFVPDNGPSAPPSQRPKITEYGPSWANERLPFLGQTFIGEEGCLDYFKNLAIVLQPRLTNDTFPDPSGFVVDENATTLRRALEAEDAKEDLSKGIVTVIGHGEFSSKKTGKAWTESFHWRLSGFDEDGRIGHWEIWADPLSAWDAVGP